MTVEEEYELLMAFGQQVLDRKAFDLKVVCRRCGKAVGWVGYSPVGQLFVGMNRRAYQLAPERRDKRTFRSASGEMVAVGRPTLHVARVGPESSRDGVLVVGCRDGTAYIDKAEVLDALRRRERKLKVH